MRNLLTAWRFVGKLFRSHRKLWIPFALTACVEALGLLALWLAPHKPFSTVLAPPIRYFFGDRVLHYPMHLWFLYHAMQHTSLVASVLAGAFFSGIACAMVRQTHQGQTLSFREALIGRKVRYGRLVLLWLITWGVAKGAVTLASEYIILKNLWALATIVGLTMLLQGLFAYIIPAAVFEPVAWWRALLCGVREAVRHPFSTLAIVVLPSFSLVVFSIICSPTRVNQWMMQSAPEVVLVFVALRLALWTVTDAVMTIGVAHLWWLHRDSVLAVAPVQQVAGSAVMKTGAAVAFRSADHRGRRGVPEPGGLRPRLP